MTLQFNPVTIWDAADTSLKNLQKVRRAINTMQTLTGDYRRGKVTVMDIPQDENGGQLVGRCLVGWLDIELDPLLFKRYAVNKDAFMPIARSSRVSTLLYIVAHEWGHSQDRRDHRTVNKDARQCPYYSQLPEPSQEPYEAYADCYAEWYLSKGKTKHQAAQWYAERFDW